jgi:glycerophosphoryl diester phosphodiesterase
VGERPLLLAHRGDQRRAPENSLAALRAAFARKGCDGVELDVRHAADGTPVVLHDASLARVQGMDVLAADLSAAELAAAGVPMLADVLAAAPLRAFLDVELKEPPTERTLAPLRAGRASGRSLARAVVSSFEPSWLAAVRVAEPAWPCWLNVDGRLGSSAIDAARAAGCRAISADWRLVTPATARSVAAAGLELAAWTVTRRRTLARLARLGVVAVCVEGAALAIGE